MEWQKIRQTWEKLNKNVQAVEGLKKAFNAPRTLMDQRSDHQSKNSGEIGLNTESTQHTSVDSNTAELSNWTDL